MGIYAAHCMARCLQLQQAASPLPRPRPLPLLLPPGGCEAVYGNCLLDMFAHITHFFEHKVVLLGRFNAQGLGRVEGCSRHLVVTAGEAGEERRGEEREAEGGRAPCREVGVGLLYLCSKE